MDDVAAKKARLDALRIARDQGVLQVRHGDTTTTFRSLAEMNAIIRTLAAELAASPRPRVRYVRQSTKAL